MRDVGVVFGDYGLYSAVRRVVPDGRQARESLAADAVVMVLVADDAVAPALENVRFGGIDPVFAAGLLIEVVNAQDRREHVRRSLPTAALDEAP